ncbi:MAG: NfeD family protein [Nitriliruptoraceae bacterium]
MPALFAVALRRAVLIAVALPVLLLAVVPDAHAQPTPFEGQRCDGDAGGGEPRRVEVLPLRGGFIDPPVVDQVGDVVDAAAANDAELIVLQYASRGGVSADLDRLLTMIDDSPVPVAVLVGPLGTQAQAAGAAALLWAAADVRAVAHDATVGPVEPADLADLGDTIDEAALLAPLVADAGADPGLTEALLGSSLTADELDAAGMVTMVAGGLEPLLVDLDGVAVATAAGKHTFDLPACDVEVRFHSLGLVRRMLHAATTGPFIYLLLVAGVGMLLFELFQPGFGVAGIAGIITAAIGAFGLTVLPVAWWAVALVLLGLGLFALDTAIAGFGPVTLLSTAAFAVGSVFFYRADALALSGWLIAATTATVFVFFVFVMTSLLRAQAGPEGVAVEDLVGRPGIVRSVLNPEGHVYIDGALWRARWTGDERRAKVGTPVRVHAVDGAVVLVEPFDSPASSAARASAQDTPDA